jgi:hypothetical protein
MLLKNLIKYVLLVVAIFTAINTFASSSTGIALTVAPQNPLPGEDTTITLNSFAYNLDIVKITWLVSGVKAGEGIGKKTFTVTAPTSGKETVVTAEVALPDGVVEISASVRPNTMALLWEATDSYVPPFYKGKALPTLGSEIKIVALPEIRNGSTTINPKNMTYDWKFNYENDAAASGYGKNSYTYTQDYLENTSIVGVTATTLSQNGGAAGDISIGSFLPRILFYKKDTAIGTLWENALTSGHVVGSEEVIVAAPYFVSPKNLWHPTLRWDWSINGQSIPTTDSLHPNLLPIKPNPGTSGTANISLQVNNSEKIFETVNQTLNVQF